MKMDREVLSKLGKILLVGCGGKMGHHYMEKLFNLGVKPENIIGVDISESNLNKIKNKYPGPHYTENHFEALNMKPSLAIITANSTEHLREIIRCYEAGVTKIFCEKPLVYNFKELNLLEDYNNEFLITAYLINFSQIVLDLIGFIEANKLIVTQVFSVWGKNWPGEKRAMGGDAEEEMMHPLALGDKIIKLSFPFINYKVKAIMSNVPHVQREYLREMSSLNVMFPEIMNDSTSAAYEYYTQINKLWFFIISSFNLAEQQRWVEFSLNLPEDIKDNGIPRIPPRFKARLYFDLRPLDVLRSVKAFVDPKLFTDKSGENLKTAIQNQSWRDIIRIKDARTNEIVMSKVSRVDKIQAMLKAVLEAFTTDKIDPRLVFYKQSSDLINMVHRAITSATDL